MAQDNSYGAAAYALVVATLVDLVESGRLETAENVVATAEKVLDGLAENGALDKSSHEIARTAIGSFEQQVRALRELR